MKHISNITRILLLVLSLVMILSAFAACKDNNTVDTDTEEETEGETTDPRYDADGYLKDAIPDGLNFKDEFIVLAAGTQKQHFWAEEIDTTPIGKAIYERNLTVEERLGIEFNWVFQNCYEQADQATFQSMVENDVLGAHEYDTVISYNLLPYTMANKGYCVNLANTKYIDLEAPWWPQVFLDHMLYKNQIFTLVNASGKGTIENLSAIFFNNELIEARGLESPYDLVANNQWTVAKMKEMIVGTYEDMNNNNTVDAYDKFGVATSTDARLSCWYFGLGVKLISRNEADELELNAADERVGIAIDAIVDLFSTDDSCLVDTTNITSSTPYAMFAEERAVFYLSVVQLAEYLVYADLEIDYGIAPIPKLDAEQDRYYTHLPNTHDAWYIPITARNIDCSSAVIECMASEAYRQVEPVYYDTNLKQRYAPDERLADMYDLVRDSITFDFNYIFRFVFTKDCDTWIRNCIREPLKYKWSSSWQNLKDAVEYDLQKIVNTYDMRVTD